ncbi:MAG: hypothetical protein E6418_01605 [Leclercia adecarboxylata]|uniref:hypothetical protein n=1 Tax=Leclercia adecarboxylata TaxID=83655 RepID=UPI0025B08C46|nr:hypothetical protein [Leclercia adecarboxylata]MDU6817629.1 hypothetical protein [Leclercia adecarboxylata]WJT03663.1 hypothetical protein OCT50_02415 [Leclercia adecarboxylata]
MTKNNTPYLSNVKSLLLSVVLIIIGCGITPYASFNIAWLFLLAGLFLCFKSILDSKRLSRIEKGITLIFFGLFMGFGIPALVLQNYTKIITNDFKEHLHLFEQMALYVCAGAGGGILANYAENIKTVDVSPYVKNEADIITADLIKTLQAESRLQRKKVEQLLLVVIATVLLGVANLIVTIFK